MSIRGPLSAFGGGNLDAAPGASASGVVERGRLCGIGCGPRLAMVVVVGGIEFARVRVGWTEGRGWGGERGGRLLVDVSTGSGISIGGRVDRAGGSPEVQRGLQVYIYQRNGNEGQA